MLDCEGYADCSSGGMNPKQAVEYSIKNGASLLSDYPYIGV